MSAFRIFFAVAAWPFEEKPFIVKDDRRYYSPRYKKWLTVLKGFRCDGSTWSPNIGWAWLFHDWIFARGVWDDGTPILWRQANRVMVDIMKEEGLPPWVRKIYRCGIRSKYSFKAWQKHRQTK